MALGGDGTILRALRAYARTAVPVFAVNFGQVGFLATVEPDADAGGLRARARRHARRAAAAGDRARAAAPAATSRSTTSPLHRTVGGRVAELSYAVGGEEVGSVRCDGLVVATPAGSTGYNLANGGPGDGLGRGGHGGLVHRAALAERARAGDRARRRADRPQQLARGARGRRSTGARSARSRPQEVVRARFADGVATLAQMEGSSFYRRLREKFGALSR